VSSVFVVCHCFTSESFCHFGNTVYRLCGQGYRHESSISRGPFARGCVACVCCRGMFKILFPHDLYICCSGKTVALGRVVIVLVSII